MNTISPLSPSMMGLRSRRDLLLSLKLSDQALNLYIDLKSDVLWRPRYADVAIARMSRTALLVPM